MRRFIMKKHRRILILFLALVLIVSMSACNGKNESNEAGPYKDFVEAIDTDYGMSVIEGISAFGDDPATGNRSAGSPAQDDTASFIKDQMEEIGLQNITVDEVDTNGWVFKGANLTFTNTSGEEQEVTLGGYATQIKADNEKIDVVYLGEGTAADYEGVDVTGKLVLIDVDQINEWWITYPAFQAKVKGAKAVLAWSIMEEENGERLGSQDICGPADAPALAISQDDSGALQEAIKAGGGDSVEVIFNADSEVTKDAKTQNVWGEIPGKTDEVIYMLAHMDGYYHSQFDDAQGVSQVLMIAKAMVDSGYEPDKTIRFVTHGAEEWGFTDYEADWAIGSWKQITEVHPEWPEKGFALVNMDGCYCLEDNVQYGVETSNELTAFVQDALSEKIEKSDFEIAWSETPNTWREDFGYSLMGIPAVATTDGDSEKYDAYSYHQDTDSIAAVGFNNDAYQFITELFGKVIFDFDAVAVRPMDFTARFDAFAESLNDSVITDEELIDLIEDNADKAKQLTERINDLNEQYAKALEDEDADTTASIKEEATELNSELYDAFLEVQQEYLRLNWWMESIFPHEAVQENILAARSAVASLQDGDGEAALESLYEIPFCYEASVFDRETCENFVNRLVKEVVDGNSWNKGLVEKGDSGLEKVVSDIFAKVESGNSDYAEEIDALNDIISKQEGYIDDFVKSEKASLELTGVTMMVLANPDMTWG